MLIDSVSGLVKDIRYLPSAHHDARPDSALIDMIVIHGISLPPAQFGSGAIEKFFCGKLDYTQHPYFATLKTLRVSSHLLIDREGQTTQFVPFTRRAWHAGQSCFEGQENCNDFSIGIELEGTDELPYEKIQYAELAKMIKLLMNTYPAITRMRILGHSDIAPGRKTDPGAVFDWVYLDALLEG